MHGTGSTPTKRSTTLKETFGTLPSPIEMLHLATSSAHLRADANLLSTTLTCIHSQAATTLHDRGTTTR
jgi:hypothetical protein